MFYKHFYSAFLLTLFSMIQKSEANYFKHLTFYLKPYENECFFQWFEKNMNIGVDYMVSKGDVTSVDIKISSPSGKKLFSEDDHQSGGIQFSAEDKGAFSICFSSKHSSMKLVSFTLYTYGREADFTDPTFPQSTPNIGMKLAKDELERDLEKSFRKSVGKVLNNLVGIMRIQSYLKGYEDIDEFLMHSKLGKVNFLSMLSICLMIFAGVGQVILIRSLFENKSKIGRVLRGKYK